MQVPEPRAQRRGGRAGGKSPLPRNQDGTEDPDLEGGPRALMLGNDTPRVPATTQIGIEYRSERVSSG